MKSLFALVFALFIPFENPIVFAQSDSGQGFFSGLKNSANKIFGQIGDKFNEYSQNFGKRLDETGAELRELSEAQGQRAQELMQKVQSKLTDMCASTRLEFETMSKQLQTKTRDAIDAIKDNGNELNDQAQKSVQNFMDTSQDWLKQTREREVELMKQLSEMGRRGSDQAQQQYNEMRTQMEQKLTGLQEQVDSLRESVKGATGDARDRLQEELTNITDQINVVQTQVTDIAKSVTTK